ncbi:MAG: hypothetical protein WBM69_04270 [Desulfobacterales bacterium]
MDVLILDDMIIVKGENKWLLGLIQFIAQDAGQNRERREWRRVQNDLDFFAGGWGNGLNNSH